LLGSQSGLCRSGKRIQDGAARTATGGNSTESKRLLTHWALATLICIAATTEGIAPDRIKSLATLRIVRRSVTDRAAFPPAPHDTLWTRTVHQVGRPHNRNPSRRHRSYPRAVKRTRRSSYRERRPSDKSIRHAGPPTVTLLPQQPRTRA
jgi:hypothetical protein